MARSKKQICWVVAHPEIGTAFVTADSWEQATVAAADFWGVPWGKYVGRDGAAAEEGGPPSPVLPVRADLPLAGGLV